MKKQKTSAAIQLLDLVWANANTATAHSWERLNHAMHKALSLAIGAGFEFSIGDMAHVGSNYRSGYWIGDSSEWIYHLAIASENATAYQSYEAWKKREPFIADDVEMQEHGGFIHANFIGRQRERLSVGARFEWKGAKLKVNSFAADQSYVNAASYKPRKKGEYGDKIDKRFKISRADILAERAERKERGQLMESLTKAATAAGTAETITKALGVKTKSDYAKLPIEKIRKVAAKFVKPSESAA